MFTSLLYFSDFTYKQYQTLFAFLCLISIMPSKFISSSYCWNGKFCSFFLFFCLCWLRSCSSLAPSRCGAWAAGPTVRWPCGMWDLSSPTRNRTQVLCIGRWILNHWTTQEVPKFCSFLWLSSIALYICITSSLFFRPLTDTKIASVSWQL